VDKEKLAPFGAAKLWGKERGQAALRRVFRIFCCCAEAIINVRP